VGFYINSDIYYNFDGFYFDDFVLSVVKPKLSIPNVPGIIGFTAYYNVNTKKIIINNVENTTTFSLFSVEGKLLDRFSVDNKNYELSVSNLQSGVYFLKANSGKTQKVVIY
jgi:hypothetical protein